jgi:hypothetical protein
MGDRQGLEILNLANFSCTIENSMKMIAQKQRKTRRGAAPITGRGWFEDPQHRWTEGAFINCDLRFFDLQALGGDFGVVYADPPWQEVQNTDLKSSHRFGEAQYYQTLSDTEIKGVPVQQISKTGFLFLWIPSSKLEIGLDCLNSWGYTYVDRVMRGTMM